MIAAGLALAVGSAIAIGGGYTLQHSSASQLPPLTLRRPVRSLALLFRSGRWAVGFFAGIGGWVLYVVALRLAPLSLVQAASAGGIGVLALGGPRLRLVERIGVGAALGGLVLLAFSVGAHPPTAHGGVAAVSITKYLQSDQPEHGERGRRKGSIPRILPARPRQCLNAKAGDNKADDDDTTPPDAEEEEEADEEDGCFEDMLAMFHNLSRPSSPVSVRAGAPTCKRLDGLRRPDHEGKGHVRAPRADRENRQAKS